MGLSAPKKRTKLAHDPNNVNWARSTSGFGHKILSSQGWTPGSYLGKKDAAHAEMYSAASASHIRVVLKDDTLGLGARSKADPMNEPTGLDAFKGLLGRLNGKSDAVLEEEQRKRDDVKLARYAATKWQEVRFVSGGLLVQEKNEQKDDDKKATQIEDNSTEKKKRKSKDDSADGSDVDDSQAATKSKKSKKKDKSSRSKSSDETSKSERKREKKAKKRKHAEENPDSDSETQEQATSQTESSATEKSKDKSSSSSAAVSRERRPQGRQIFRGRHIAQKKKALMDDKSLNEIFMVKSQA